MSDTTSRSRLVRFFEKYNPEKVSTVDKILESYAGKEEQLFKALAMKYGPEPDPATSPECDIRPRLVRFFEKYNAEKVSTVDQILVTYAGKEDKLFEVLTSKYGPEPGETPRCRLLRFYTKYQPGKLEQVDTILHKYSGREEELLDALVQNGSTTNTAHPKPKYGPEPSPRSLPPNTLLSVSVEELARLNEVARSVVAFDAPFVLSEHLGQGKRGIRELKGEIELLVDTKAGLQELLSDREGLEAARSSSSLVSVCISFSEPLEPGEVCALMRLLGPHVVHLKAQCTSAAHCAAIIEVMKSCAKEHLRIVSLLETNVLKRSAVDEFLKLSKTEVEVLHFSAVPTEGVWSLCELSRQCPQLRIQSAPDDTVARIPFSPQWTVKEVRPVSQLLKGEWGFIAADPTAYPPWIPICLPVDEALAKQHSQLLCRMVEDQPATTTTAIDSAKGDEPFVFNVSGEDILNVHIVQLLVTYIEKVPPLTDDQDSELFLALDWELTYEISGGEEFFLHCLEERCGSMDGVVLSTAVALLRVGDYLQMPVLRRLMRSFIVRREARLPEEL